MLSPISKNSVSVERKLRVIDENEENHFFKIHKLEKKTSTEEMLNALDKRESEKNQNTPEIQKKKNQLQILIKSITSDHNGEKLRPMKISKTNKNNASSSL